MAIRHQTCLKVYKSVLVLS